MKKYLIYSLKHYVPLFAITFAVFFSIYLSIFSNVPNFQTINYESGNAFVIPNNPSIIIVCAVPLVILTTIMPFMANSYRYRLNGADVFYQIGKGKKQVRYYNNLILLAACLVSFTVAFFFGFFVMLLKQLPTLNKEPEVIDYGYGYQVIKYYFAYNYLYFLPVYLCLLVVGIINYAISYFLVTRSNNVVNSMITLALGHFILGIGLMTPFWYITIFYRLLNPGEAIPQLSAASNFLGGTHTAYVVGPIAWIIYLFCGQISGNPSLVASAFNNFYPEEQTLSMILSFASIALYLGVGALAIYKFIKEPESSGELCGRAPGRGKLQIIIFHTGFGLIGLWVGTLQSMTASYNPVMVALVLSEMVFFGAIYYVFLGLLRRNFRLNKKEIFIMFSNVSVNTIISICASVVAAANYGQSIGY